MNAQVVSTQEEMLQLYRGIYHTINAPLYGKSLRLWQ